MPKIEVTLGIDGSIKAEGLDFVGKTCEEASQFLDDLFGVKSTDHKSEYYEKDATVCDSVGNGFCG